VANEKIANIIIECLKDKQVQDEFRNLLDEQSQKITDELKQCDRCERVKDLNSLRTEKQIFASKLNEVENSNNELKREIQGLEQDILGYKNKGFEQEHLIDNHRQRVQVLEQQVSAQEKCCDEKQETINDLRDKVQKLESAIADYESVTGKIKLVLEKYRSVGDNTKRQLSNVFRCMNSGAIMAAGSQWQNIEGLWNYIQRKVIEGDNLDMAALTDMFIFFFNNYNEMFDTPMYELIIPRIGDRYDSDFHCILGTKTDGTISKVSLVGYINIKTKKVNKALIEV